ncbi:ACT domain-containing protein [Actinomyces sp. B33]|uniref:ACT domain-containing protein n=1 Tax=Actinomyces sp. B33 TaxID=2942131 RepID=UPI0023410692|nr:ACT domain-containing protein [Actinomyces sp. B33]MDC4232289.1 ACT domain-containing protein [Actinomyces sp. B33]
MSSMPNFDQALASLSATFEGEYVFALVDDIPTGIRPFAIVRDADLYTVVLSTDQAADAGLPTAKTYARISLGLAADLDSIGITSTVSQVLSARSIVANVITSARQTHLFVQADRAQEAADLLTELGRNAQGWLPKP